MRAALVLLLLGMWSPVAVAQEAPPAEPPADGTADPAAGDASEAPDAVDPAPDGDDERSSSDDQTGSATDDASAPAVDEAPADDASADAEADASAETDDEQTDAPEQPADDQTPAEEGQPGGEQPSDKASGDKPDADQRGRDWWKGAGKTPGEEPAVQEQPSPPRPTPLQAPRSTPYMSIAAGGGACLAASCLGPLCTLGGLASAVGWLFVSPPALFGVAPCISGGAACAGLGSGVCVTGVGGSTATTAAAASVPYFDADEEDAAWDAAVGGLPALVLAAAALLVAPLSMAVAYVAVTEALFQGQVALTAQVLGAALILVVLPLGLLPSLLLAACAPVAALVGTSGARMHYASSGPEADLVTAAPSPPDATAVAMRF